MPPRMSFAVKDCDPTSLGEGSQGVVEPVLRSDEEYREEYEVHYGVEFAAHGRQGTTMRAG